MKTGVKVVNRRPYCVQQQWDQYAQHKRGRRVLWSVFKIVLIPSVVIGFLVLGATKLSFG
jgi:hypothetical protein